MNENTVHLTQEQYDNLVERRRELKEVELPRNARAIEEAKSYGDLSENAEYDAAKDENGRLNAELRLIESRLTRASIIEKNQQFDVVQIGHTVTLLDQQTNLNESFKLIGQDGDGINDVDVYSKLGRSVLNCQVGQEFSYESIDSSIGTLRYKVLKIE